MRAYHGSPTSNLTQLESSALGGKNGCVDGVGVYLTSSLTQAFNYAQGQGGSIYVVDAPSKNLISIDDCSTLDESQSYSAIIDFDNLDVGNYLQLINDIGGKIEHTFTDKQEAEAFFKNERKWAEQFNIHRLKPDVKTADGKFIISVARRTLDIPELAKAPTASIHKALCRIDPLFCTKVFGAFCHGLILPIDEDTSHYLLFDDIKPEHEHTVSNESVTNQINQINESMSELDRIRGSVVIGDNRRHVIYIKDDGSITERNPYNSNGSIYFEKFPKPHFSPMGCGNSNLTKKAMQNILRDNPELEGVEIRFDNYKISVGEYCGEDMGYSEYFYHGTSTALIDSIIKDGLLPRDMSGSDAHFVGAASDSLTDRVYLADKFGIGAASFAARSAVGAHGGTPIILRINKSNLPERWLAPDEDSGKSTFAESLGLTGTCAFMGKIPSNVIEVANDDFIPDDIKNSLIVQAILERFAILRDHPKNENAGDTPAQQPSSPTTHQQMRRLKP